MTTKRRRIAWDDIDNAYWYVVRKRYPTDNRGQQIQPGHVFTGMTLDDLVAQVVWSLGETSPRCHRRDFGFECPTTEESLLSQASWETIGRQDRGPVGYAYDLRRQVVYRITPHATYAEVEAVFRRMMEVADG